MATAVFFHAHPDDESIATGGTMALAAARGHRVVLVVATRGEHGERPDDLAPGETLADRRMAETARSAEVLGVARVEYLGYVDSGMDGWEQNGHEASFWQADVDEAAARLARILEEESADVLTCYDWHGNYGHPDHVQVHRVGHRAAELAGTRAVYEATINRDHVRRLMAQAREAGLLEVDRDLDVDGNGDGEPFGMAEEDLTTAIDVRDVIDKKRHSMTCHASQISDSSFFLNMPLDAFREAFGTEWYIHKGVPAGIHEHSLLGLD